MHENCEASRRAFDGPVGDVFELNRAFHAAVVEPCGNPILLRMIEQLWQLPSSMRIFHQQISVEDDATLRRSIDEHEEILAAIEAEDVELVAARLTAHIESALAEAELRLRQPAA